MQPKPKIDTDKCTGCEACVNICPMEILKLNEEKKASTDKADECIGCRACEVQCPVSAIKIVDE